MAVIAGDSKDRQPADRQRATDEIGRRQSVPLSEDWVEMDASLFSYSAANAILVDTSIDIDEKFQLSDQYRIVQGGTTKYFYNINQGNNKIYVDGGDVTVANQTITSFAISRNRSPFGMPGGLLQYTPSIGADSGAISFDDQLFLYKMEGKLITVYGDAGVNCDSGAFEVYFSLPFPQGVPQTAAEAYVDSNVPVYMTSEADNLGLLNILTVAHNYDDFVITPKDFSTIGTTFFRTNFTRSYLYLPPDI